MTQCLASSYWNRFFIYYVDSGPRSSTLRLLPSYFPVNSRAREPASRQPSYAARLFHLFSHYFLALPFARWHILTFAVVITALGRNSDQQLDPELPAHGPQWLVHNG